MLGCSAQPLFSSPVTFLHVLFHVTSFWCKFSITSHICGSVVFLFLCVCEEYLITACRSIYCKVRINAVHLILYLSSQYMLAALPVVTLANLWFWCSSQEVLLVFSSVLVGTVIYVLLSHFVKVLWNLKAQQENSPMFSPSFSTHSAMFAALPVVTLAPLWFWCSSQEVLLVFSSVLVGTVTYMFLSQFCLSIMERKRTATEFSYALSFICS